MQQPDYTPINCNFYDILEGISTRNVPATVVYTGDTGETFTGHGLISNIFAKEGVEYLELDGQVIARLDKIVTINGMKIPG